MHVRLKHYNDIFSANPWYIFHALDWFEKNAVASSVHSVARKQFQSEINVVQLVDHNNVRTKISDDQIFSSFRNFRVAPQYSHHMVGYPC